MDVGDFETLFNHYDKSKQGFIDSDSALLALISDMMRRSGGEINAHEVEKVRKAVLAVCDSGVFWMLIIILCSFFITITRIVPMVICLEGFVILYSYLGRHFTVVLLQNLITRVVIDNI